MEIKLGKSEVLFKKMFIKKIKNFSKYLILFLFIIFTNNARAEFFEDLSKIIENNEKRLSYGIQFHIEIKDTTVNEWGCVPEYKKALENQLGDGALKKFDRSAKENMTDMNNYSKTLYNNFKKIL